MANNVKFRQIKAFLLASEAGSFSAGAARLCVSPPSFTDLIRDLEEELGVKLFERTTRKVSLTAAGIDFLGRIQRPMLDIDEAYEHMKDVRHARSGLVIVGCLPSIAVSLIPKVLLELRRDRPKLQIRVIEVHNEPLLEMLRMNAIELGLGTLMEETGDLRLRKLVDDEFVVVAPDAMATQLPSQMTWEDLASQDVILTSLGSTPREQFERSYSFKPKRIRPVYEVTHISTALAMVREGLGLAVLPRIALYALPTTDLKLIKLAEPNAARTLGILQRTDRTISPAGMVFIEAMERVAKATELAPLSPNV
ncbi:LysR family transcriptional regulator [Ottowia thiooxydans]|uniref:LysR family carnitine catabolism transcriptional activator n=1 Tax=Ottowia thiooxydans TaxID=219182 RepID=A0ABV2Q848_9BURK